MNSEDAMAALREAFSLGSGNKLKDALLGLISDIRKNRGDVLSRPQPTADELYRANGAVVALDEMEQTLNALFEKANEVR